MTWADYAIVAILGTSALLSFFRGFVREAFAVAGWVAAFWLAMTFGEDIARALAPYVDVPSVRLGAGYVLVFVGALVATALVSLLVGMLVDSTGLSTTDRMLGVVFGVARGAAIVALLVLLAGFTAMPRDRWWRDAVLIPHFESLALTVRRMLPPEIAEHLTYDRAAAMAPGPGRLRASGEAAPMTGDRAAPARRSAVPEPAAWLPRAHATAPDRTPAPSG